MGKGWLTPGGVRSMEHPGTQPKRWSPSRRRGSKLGPREDPPAAPDPPSEPDTPVGAPETADIYRSLFNDLRRAFGGTIDDSNADAIAFAAAELYHKDVEPRLWEQKSAQEILDSFGVPRAGAFSRYSLTDRLLLLRRSASPDRTAQAHALLTELGTPESDEDGSPRSLKERIEWLLEGVEAQPAPARRAAPPPEEKVPTPPEAVSADGNGPPPEQLVEALQTLRDAAQSDAGTTDGSAASAPAPVEAPGAELVGLGALVASMQEELIRLRQAVENVQSRLDETLQLLRAGTVTATVPPSAPVADPVPAVLPADAADADVDAEREAAPATAHAVAPPDDALVEPGPEPEIAAADDVTQVVPVVTGGTALEDVPATPAAGRRRRRSLPKLLVIAVILGLLVAGVAIAISAVGWSEMREKLNIGAVGLATVLLITPMGTG